MNIRLLLNRFERLAWVMGSARLLRALLAHGVLAGAEHRRVLKHELKTVVDIGANKGQFSLAARRWAPGARVVAFEPLPGPADVFCRIFAGDGRVILHPVAIGPVAAIQTMHRSAREDSSSLLPISDAQATTFPGTQEIGTAQVRVAALEEFLRPEDLPSPALLKLDVQGYEFEALQGCESLLHCFDRVYCECSFVEFYTGQKLADDVIAWLAQRGFELERMCNPITDGERTLQADFLFRRMGSPA
ncbi:MAG TPA: FkbM family methyltransferase [Rhodocyclaceae bacterium]|nr:FkbM family methyltransferase [Rhodocyclaceae bacterium]